MRTLEHYLALEILRSSQRVEEPRIESKGEHLLVSFKANNRKYKTMVKRWDDEQMMLVDIVAGDLIRQGYFIVPINGGYLVVNKEGEEYEVTGEECTCPDYHYMKSTKLYCKHQAFRDWYENNQQRIKLYSQYREVEVVESPNQVGHFSETVLSSR